MKPFYLVWATLTLSVAAFTSQAQTTTGGVRIGTAGAPDASAVLDLSPDAATAPKGLLPPRVTLAQRTNIASPATGLVVFQTDNTPGLYLYNGTAWVLQGDNLGNHTATQNLNLGANQLVGNGGSQGLAITGSGLVGIGTTSPYSQLANTNTNIIGSDGNGGDIGSSFAWVGRQVGYAAMIHNSSATGGAGGLAVKVTSAAAAALDVSKGTGQLTPGTSLLRVLSNGNVGIGTGNPAQKLDVNGNQNLTGTLQLNTGDQDKIYLTSQGAAGSKLGHAAGWGLLSYAGPGTGSQGYQAWLLSGASAYQERMRLNATGLGLGTNAPTQLLELAGQAAPTVLLHSNGNNLVNGASLQFRESSLTYGWNLRHNNGGNEGGTTDDRLILESVDVTGNAPVMTWNQNSGNVGIGTNMPLYKLDVVGDARVSGTLDVGVTTQVGGTFTIPANSATEVRVGCPTGTTLLGGGGGYKYFDADIYNVVLNYSGPDPNSPTTTWLLRVSNVNSTTRDIYYNCNCARLR